MAGKRRAVHAGEKQGKVGQGEVLGAVTSLLADIRVTKVMCDSKQTLAVLGAAGMQVGGALQDPLVAHWLLKCAKGESASPHAHTHTHTHTNSHTRTHAGDAEGPCAAADRCLSGGRDSVAALAKIYGTTSLWARVGDALNASARSRGGRRAGIGGRSRHAREKGGGGGGGRTHEVGEGCVVARVCAEAACCGMLMQVRLCVADAGEAVCVVLLVCTAPGLVLWRHRGADASGR